MRTRKNRNSWKLARFFVVIALLAAMAVSMTQIAFAAGSPPDGAEITDTFSDWAAWDILVAESVYGLGDEGTYSNYRGSFTDTKFMAVYETLNNRFNASGAPDIANKSAVTRGEIVTALYGLIAEVLELDKNQSAVDYFAANGLINGRAYGDYKLEQTCLTQEMIVFALRVYEHLVYELDEDSAGLFWKITCDGFPNTVYLLGTVHLGTNSIYPLSKTIMDAFDSSAYLAVEANIYTISDEDAAYMADKQLLTDGSTISDYISEETYEIYKAVAESFGLPPEMYDYYKPWAAYLGIMQTLASSGGEGEGADTMLGIDMYLLTKAFYFDKDVVEVESIKYQVDMFESFSPELQDMLLLSVIAPSDDEGESEFSQEEIAEMVREYIGYMIEAIRNGDEATLTDMLLASRNYSNPLMREYNTKLWDRRDEGMAETLVRFLGMKDAEGDFFVAVGAGHTVGESGIASVLTKMGYTVERLK